MTKKNNENTIYINCDKELLPHLASKGSAGFDLKAKENIIIEPGETVLIPTGIKLAMPPGVEAQVRPRSGLSLKTSLRIPNSPGTIDSDYRDEICVIAENNNPLFLDGATLIKNPELAEELQHNYEPCNFSEYFNEKSGLFLPFGLNDPTIYLDAAGHPAGSIYIKAGERIAQIVFIKLFQANFELVDSVEDIGENRGGGFGSSGV